MRPTLTLAVLLGLIGCGGDSDQSHPTSPPAPAKGRITHRGKPLTGGRVIFEPTDGGHEARGEIGPDGSFVLTTHQDGDGAVLGVHRVLIEGVMPPPKTRGETHVRVIDSKAEYAVDLK